MLADEVRRLRQFRVARPREEPGLGDLLRRLAADFFGTKSPRSRRLMTPATPPRRAGSVAERLAESGAWLGPGDVGVEDGRLVLRGPTTNTAGLATIEEVVQDDDLVWVRRRRAHDWLVACASEADAQALAESLRPSPDTARAS